MQEELKIESCNRQVRIWMTIPAAEGSKKTDPEAEKMQRPGKAHFVMRPWSLRHVIFLTLPETLVHQQACTKPANPKPYTPKAHRKTPNLNPNPNPKP